MENIQDSKSVQAYKKVEQIKKFYWFLATAIFINVFLFGMAYFLASNGAPNLVVWILLSTPLGFGVILFTEYMRVFNKNPVFGKKWEERKIKQFMEEDRIQSEKYK